MADASNRRGFFHPVSRDTFRFVLAIGLPPFLPLLMQFYFTGTIDRFFEGPSLSRHYVGQVPTTWLLPGSTIIGIGWALGCFLLWWYRGRAGNCLVWLTGFAIAGALGGYLTGEPAKLMMFLGLLYGLIVGLMAWILLRWVQPVGAELPSLCNPSPIADPDNRNRKRTRVLRIAAIILLPSIPYLSMLALADAIKRTFSFQPYDIVLHSDVVFIVMLAGWTLGAIMQHRWLEYRWGPLVWTAFFSFVGFVCGMALISSGKPAVPVMLSVGAAGGLFVWLVLRITADWHRRPYGAASDWIVAGLTAGFVGTLFAFYFPAIETGFIWPYMAFGTAAGFMTGPTMWAVLRCLR